ncbi:ankyrin [Aaosphaeria arxii CBS 175.79]|uniref:Ankyrin n=1 Tax=Aaosphaeria arxii CBS 175.79 TaxID=1450172 RepID=A0A6A5XN16_9PLEO|nr:ankyrin [Aaosphaeria arxii CBS 175.79]KAF2014140.1 ankyrin [Aaosphaeria arxii CBS 175.79]
MDPLSVAAGVIAILQATGIAGQGVHKLLALRDAPQQLYQLWNEAEALRALVLETESVLRRMLDSNGYDLTSSSIGPSLEKVKEHVVEFEELIRNKLSRPEIVGSQVLPKVRRLHWLRAGSDIQRIKQNIRDSREILKDRLALISINDSHDLKSHVLQIQSIALTSSDAIRQIEDNQRETQASLIALRVEQQQNYEALQTTLTCTMQPILGQMEQMTLALTRTQGSHLPTHNTPGGSNPPPYSPWAPPHQDLPVRVSATIASHQCPKGCKCQCHTRSSVRTPTWCKNVFGRLMWTYSSSISMRYCNYAPCRKSLGKHHFTYYFPPWLVSRALVVSAALDDLSGAGAKLSINVPLIVPEESHIVWSLVMAGNLEQLRVLVAQDKNLMYVRNQWGQNIMHVAAKIHQPAIFNYLLDMGMDANLPDENQKTATTTVITRRGAEEYDLPIDADDLADRLGWTELHKIAALTHKDRPLTEAILKAEYDTINSKDNLGRTPLHWLAENGDVDGIKLLTQDPWRADVHVRDNMGFTALHCACWADSLASSSALLDAGSNPNAQDKHERTPVLFFEDSKILDLLIEKGADLLVSDDEGANFMHHVAIADQGDLAMTLLERYGDKLCVPNYSGDTPIGLAIQSNSLQVLAALVTYMDEFPVEKINSVNKSKRNILHIAALYGTTESMDMLAEAGLIGLDPDALDKDGHTPNECFIQCRDANHATTRKRFELENESWTSLMATVRRQGKPLFEMKEVEKVDVRMEVRIIEEVV